MKFSLISLMIICLLILLIVINCTQKNTWKPVPGKLITRWATQVTPEKVWPEYPRPQMVRENWLNLNGLWEYAIRPKADGQPEKFDGQILVPFPVESSLSGVGKSVGAENRLWYRLIFEIPNDWQNQRVLLHFGAIDWESTIWVNGQELGFHRGGYDAFTIDITTAIEKVGPQTLVLVVWDPTDAGTQPRGKQVDKPHSIWYTSVTGIWQTVWLEPVAEKYIADIKIVPDIDAKLVKMTVTGSEKESLSVQIKINEGKTLITEAKGVTGTEIQIPIPEPKLWSPDTPFLYDFEASLLNEQNSPVDVVTGYLGMRKIGVNKDDKGVNRLFLNNQPLFQIGPLDQGWWPDGLYLPATDEALRYDIEVTKKLGFNMARKHVKIEPERWYYWCDKLGLLVWQDMPSGDRYIGTQDHDIVRTPESAEQFRLELKQLIHGRFNHPSIVMWVPFNEGWGQFETEKIVQEIRDQDPTRLVNNTSGWTDRGVGDVNDIHSYPGPAAPLNEPNRAAVLGEFGGLGLPLPGHTWQDEKNWGYRSFTNADDLTRAYQELLIKLQPLILNGLSAAVYTQTSDVEIEVNGLMTYDREIIKMNPEIVAMANQGFVPPYFKSEDNIFLETGQIEILSTKPGVIRYTLDGSEPDEQSAIYENPILVSQTTTVKARTFWPDGKKSDVSSFTVTLVTLTEPVMVSNPQSGLKVNYYEGQWTDLPDFSKLTPVQTAIAKVFDLSPSPKNQNFGLRFEGYIRVPVEGIYSFFSTSDDGSRILVAGQKVVDNDGQHGMQEKSGKIALKAGYHPLILEFFQGVGGLGLEAAYTVPNQAKQVIPARVLFHE